MPSIAAQNDSNALDRGTIIVAAVVLLGAIMSILDTTVINVAIDRLAIEFHASLTTIQWVVTGYTLALAAVIPLTGWAADRFGTKRLYLGSLALFMLGSALCAGAWSAGSLIAFRVLQGFGGGMIMPIVMTILTRKAGPERMGRVMGLLGMPMLAAPILGPILGGWLVDDVSWRWIFLINIPIGVVAIALATIVLERDEPQPAHRLDWLGMALLSPGLTALIFGLAESNGGGFGATKSWLPIVAGAALIAGFLRHSWDGRGTPDRHPHLHPHGGRARGRDPAVVRDRLLRIAAADPALLPDGARRLGARSGPADGAAGARVDDHDAARRQAHRPLRAEPLARLRDPVAGARARSVLVRRRRHVLRPALRLQLRTRAGNGHGDDADDDRGDAGGAEIGDRPHEHGDEHPAPVRRLDRDRDPLRPARHGDRRRARAGARTRSPKRSPRPSAGGWRCSHWPSSPRSRWHWARAGSPAAARSPGRGRRLRASSHCAPMRKAGQRCHDNSRSDPTSRRWTSTGLESSRYPLTVANHLAGRNWRESIRVSGSVMTRSRALAPASIEPDRQRREHRGEHGRRRPAPRGSRRRSRCPASSRALRWPGG